MRSRRDFFGPPVELSNAHVLTRIHMNCIVCEDCGEPWHFKAASRPGTAVQTNLLGRCMTVRKAVYIAIGKKVPAGRRITSLCTNKHCCNPELLRAATPGKILQNQYESGMRNRAQATAHLIKYTNTKVSDEAAARMREDPRPKSVAAPDYGIAPDYFTRIRRGEARMPRNIFSALLR